jgi:hypothetical protein
MSPAALIAAATVANGSGKVDRGEGAAVADESMLDTRGVDVVAHNLSGIVDADGLSATGAGEVHIAEGAGIIRKAAPHARQVLVHPHDQPSHVDTRRDA